MVDQLKRVRRKHRRQLSWWDRLQLPNGVILALFIVLGFGVGLFVFSSAHRAFNRWHQSRLLTEADHELDQNHLPEAEAIARQALAIAPDSVVAARILAEITEKENRSETVTWRAQVARLDPDVDSQLNLASAALRFGQLDIARAALGRVPPDDRERAAYHVVAGWLSRAQGNVIEEERHFAAAVASEPANDTYQYNLAALQILSPDPTKSSPAREQLERLSKVTEFRTEALRALLDDALRQNQTETANELAQQLQMSPQVTFFDYLLCLDLYRKLSPKKFDALLEKVKSVATTDGSYVAQLVTWLNKNNLPGDALKWIDRLPANLTNHSPAVGAIAASLAQTKNWSRLKRWSRGGTWDEDEYLQFAYQAYAARQSRHGGAEAEFASLWATALKTAENNPDHELALARLASQWGLTTEAEPLWQKVSKLSTIRREALEALYKIYRSTNDLPNLRETAQRLQQSSPEEVSLEANAARLALLLDRNTAAGRKLAKQAYEKSPNDANVAVTYAFSLYNTGRTAEGLEILQKLPPEQLRDPHIAVYVALLFDDDNQVDIANQYIALAKAGSIYPEEKQLLEEIASHRQNQASSPASAISGGVTPSPKPE
jgi:thioredoxin-like negative regulator of GroEL